MSFQHVILAIGALIVLNSCSGTDDLGVQQVSTISISGGVSFEPESTQSENYQLFIQNRHSLEYQLVEIQSGDFEFNVTNFSQEDFGSNYFVGIVEKSLDQFKYLGPIVFQVDNGAVNYSGIVFSDDTDQFDVLFDLSNTFASLHEVSGNVSVSNQMNVLFTEGQARGVRSFGRVKSPQSPVLRGFNSVDSDQDGVPNLFDTFSDDDKLNNFRSDYGQDFVRSHSQFNKLKFISFVESSIGDTISSANVHEFTTYGVLLNGSFNSVSNLQVTKIDPDFNRARIATLPSGYTSSSILPAGSNWETGNSLNLYDITDEDDNSVKGVFIKSVNPVDDFGLIEISYDQSSRTRKILGQLNFVFANNIELRGASLDDMGYGVGAGTSADPFVMSDERTSSDIVIILPNDLQNQTFESLRGLAQFDLVTVFDYSVNFDLLNSEGAVISSVSRNINSTDVISNIFSTPTTHIKDVVLSYEGIDVSNVAKVKVSLMLSIPSGDRLTYHYFIKRQSW